MGGASSALIISRGGKGLVTIGKLRGFVIVSASSDLVVYPGSSGAFGRFVSKVTVPGCRGCEWGVVRLRGRVRTSVISTVGTGRAIHLTSLESVGTTVVLTGATRNSAKRISSTTVIGVVRGLMGRHERDTRRCGSTNHPRLTRGRLTRTNCVRMCLPGRLSRTRIRRRLGAVVTRLNTSGPSSVNGIVKITAGHLTKLTRNHLVSALMGGLLGWNSPPSLFRASGASNGEVQLTPGEGRPCVLCVNVGCLC